MSINWGWWIGFAIIMTVLVGVFSGPTAAANMWTSIIDGVQAFLTELSV